eukprot:Amastigsp_a843087_141.p4 type:complete len:154 gc:universal Amastigsp_a843087_141:1105-1566(+)
MSWGRFSGPSSRGSARLAQRPQICCFLSCWRGFTGSATFRATKCPLPSPAPSGPSRATTATTTQLPVTPQPLTPCLLPRGTSMFSSRCLRQRACGRGSLGWRCQTTRGSRLWTLSLAAVSPWRFSRLQARALRTSGACVTAARVFLLSQKSLQ